MSTPTGFSALLERFFMQRLMQQRQASPHTIISYRDTFRQFLKYAQKRLHKPPSGLRFEEIDAPTIVAFLDDLEQHGLSIRSRNLRLTALHSFSNTLRSRNHRMLHRFSEFWLSPANALPAPWFRS